MKLIGIAGDANAGPSTQVSIDLKSDSEITDATCAAMRTAVRQSYYQVFEKPPATIIIYTEETT